MRFLRIIFAHIFYLIDDRYFFVKFIVASFEFEKQRHILFKLSCLSNNKVSDLC